MPWTRWGASTMRGRETWDPREGTGKAVEGLRRRNGCDWVGLGLCVWQGHPWLTEYIMAGWSMAGPPGRSTMDSRQLANWLEKKLFQSKGRLDEGCPWGLLKSQWVIQLGWGLEELRACYTQVNEKLVGASAQSDSQLRTLFKTPQKSFSVLCGTSGLPETFSGAANTVSKSLPFAEKSAKPREPAFSE